MYINSINLTVVLVLFVQELASLAKKKKKHRVRCTHPILSENESEPFEKGFLFSTTCRFFFSSSIFNLHHSFTFLLEKISENFLIFYTFFFRLPLIGNGKDAKLKGFTE